MNTTKIMITSGAGGVGKTSFCANLGLALALSGKKTLLCDFDVSGHALELFLGCECIRDIADVARGRATPEDAIVSLDIHDNLYFIAAPSDGANVFPGAKDLNAAFAKCAEDMGFDVILMDFPSVDSLPTKIAAACCDRAIVVTRQSMLAARATEAAGYMLAERGIGDIKMIINRFDLKRRGDAYPSAVELVDSTRIQLLGIIPEEQSLPRIEEIGQLACKVKKMKCVRSAYKNISARINGESTPLLSGMRISGRKRFLLG